MKKLIALLMVLLPLGAFAQNVKIAIVDADAIIAAMPELPEIEKKMADLNAQYEKELKQMNSELQKKYADYVAQQDSLTENIKLKRQADLQDLNTRIETLTNDARETLPKKQEEYFAPVRKKVQDAIKAVGEEKGYTYMCQPQMFLYTGTDAVDATPFVKAKLGLK